MRSSKLISPVPNLKAPLPGNEVTLLDVFAMAALTTLLSTPVEDWPGELHEHDGSVSKAAYLVARSMLAERSRRGPPSIWRSWPTSSTRTICGSCLALSRWCCPNTGDNNSTPVSHSVVTRRMCASCAMSWQPVRAC